VIGDFNLPDINCNTLTASSHISSLFCDLVYDLNFTQHIDTATHIHGNILDLILTNIDDDSITNVTVHNHNNQLIKSDHFQISCEICQDTSCHSSATSNYIYDYPKADYSGLCQYLFSSNIYSCLQFNDVEIVWNIIKEALFKAIELFVPKVEVRTKQYPNGSLPSLFMKQIAYVH